MREAPLTVRVDPGPTTTVTVAGALDGDGGPRVLSAWDGGVDAVQRHVRLDLLGVTSLNAAGLQVLARIVAVCRDRGCELDLAVQGVVEWLLDLVGLRAIAAAPPARRWSPPQDRTGEA